MPIRHAQAVWEGDLRSGRGNLALASGVLQAPYSFSTRFEDEPGTNPEELLGAAHAACFSMALSHMLASAGHTPKRVHTTADVSIEKIGEAFKITRIKLTCQANVPGIDERTFRDLADKTKSGCPVSQALAATPIELEAKLTG